jgi:hypothetical protein
VAKSLALNATHPLSESGSVPRSIRVGSPAVAPSRTERMATPTARRQTEMRDRSHLEEEKEAAFLPIERFMDVLLCTGSW